VNENNVDWLFPTISDITNILDTLCVLSLTYRSNGSVTMLAPLRDYLRPEDPKSSQLLCTAKEHYFTRLSVDLYPDRPGFKEAQWISSEDVNVEYLLDIFTSIDIDLDDVWDACANFMRHLYWHKRRLTTLGSKIDRLPDDHRSKPKCLLELSQLFESSGNHVECKQLLYRALELQRKRGDDSQVTRTLTYLVYTYRRLRLYKEGAQLAKEASQIYRRLGDAPGQARCSKDFVWLLLDEGRLDDAEEVASLVINLLPEKGERFLACQCHRILGDIYLSRRKTEVAISNFEAALGIASSFD